MISKPEPVFTLLWELWAGQVVRTGHVEDIKFVINFDYPNCSEDYVHRIGRTGRSTNTGTAYTFFTPKNGKQATDLVNVLREAKQVISPKLLQLEESSKGMSGGRGRWRGQDGGRGGRGGGSRFSSSGGGGSRFSSSSGGGSRFTGSSNFSGGFKSQSNYSSSSSSSFKPQSNFSNMGGMSDYGSAQNSSGHKPYQNGAAGGYKGQWNQGGVTAASLASVQPPTGPALGGKF